MKFVKRISLLAILLSAVFNLSALAQNLTGNAPVMKADIRTDVKKANRTESKIPNPDDAQTVAARAKMELPAESMLTPGVCDTAGPIEIESSGGTLAGVPTAYATLQLAFAAINGGTLHTGTITIDVCGNTTETGTAVLNASGAGSTSYTTIGIAPAGGAARTITGNLALPLIDFSGADNVTIDGLNTGGNSLTISNTNTGATSGTSTLRFIGGATTNTITRTALQGSATMALGTNGGIVYFATDAVTANGNDNNTISLCDIGPAGANLPTKAIYGNGSTTTLAIENSGIIINNNNIFDVFNATISISAIHILSGNDNWTISNNRIYQTAARTFTGTVLKYAGITLNSTSGTLGAFTITGNTIGFGAANGTGTTTISGSTNVFRGIDAPSVNATTPTSIQGNIISGINQTTASTGTGTSVSFVAMMLGTTTGRFNVGNTTGNTIGSLDGSSTIVINENAAGGTIVAIYDFSVSSNTISNNGIGAITIQGTGTTNGFRGILVNTGTGNTVTITGNTIANITNTQVGSYSMYGIQTILPTPTITGNTIRNISGASNGSALIVGGGILVSSGTGAHIISQNTIHSLSNASGAVANSIYGMSLSLPTAANVVERNFIHSFSLTSTLTGTQIWGISGGATGTATYQNNMIRLGIDAAGASVTLPTSMIGIRDAAGSTNQFYHNTIYIGGTGVLATPAASNSYCFFSDVVTVTRAHLDNIFWNARSNAVGGGVAHIVTREGGTTANPPGLTSNYNVLYFTGTDGATGVFNAVVIPTLAAWRTATGQDLNSFANDPMLIAPNGTAATVDLHINPSVTTVIEANGILVASVTNDFDNQTRSTLTPVDIGADAGNFMGVDLAAPGITYTAFGNTTSTANRILSVTITDLTGVDLVNLPRIYFKKSTDGAYVSTQCTMTGGTAQNGTYNCTIDYSLVGGGSVTTGDIIQYFVVAQDTVGNLGSNPSGATGPIGSVTFAGTPNSYTIVPSISGNKTVGAGGDYATLTAAVAALNGAVVTAPVTFTLTDPTYGAETLPITINANAGSNSTNTVTIKPATGVSPTISGTSASCVINLNGADWTIIDGSNAIGGTSRDLTVANTGTSTSSAVVCITSTGVGAGATNNTVKNTNVAGTTTTATAQTLAGVFSGSSTISITSAGADNDSNTIQNNSITKTSYGIYSGGASAANKNTGTVITQNVMNAASPNNITTGGVLANFEDGIQISQNDMSILKHDGTTGTTNTAFGIALGVVPNNTVTTFTGSDVTNASVTRNKINGVTQLNTTGYSSFGIVINSVTSGTTLLSNNMISGVRSPSTASDFSAGIVAGGGTGSTTQIYHNSVSMTGLRGAGATFPSYGLAINSGNPVVDVRNNIFYNTQTSGSTGKSYAIANASTTGFTNMTSSFNDLFVTGASGFVGQTGGLGTAGTDQLTLANWNTATGSDAPPNSISVDPVFVNAASDLHITNTSPVLSAGTTIGSVTTDFDGDPRPALPDMGADELVQASGGSLAGGAYYNVSLTGGNTLGGNVTVNNTLYLSGISNAGANTLTLGCNAAVSGAGTNNYVVGNVRKDFCALGTFVYPVGTPADSINSFGSLPEYAPVTVTVTALATNPSSLTISSTDTFLPGLVQANAVSRYWTITETGDLTVDMTFQYLDPPQDANGVEANYKVFRRSGGFTTEQTPNSNNPGANTATVQNVSNFSDWGIGANVPLAASINIGGRVTTFDGITGLPRVRVTISGNTIDAPRTITTTPFGYYNFEDLPVGTYILTVDSKQYTFTVPTQVITAEDNILGADFTANP